MKIKFSQLYRILISTFLLGALFFIMRNSLDELLVILKSVKLGYFFLAIFLFLVIVVAISIRLKKVLSIQNTTLSLKKVTFLSLIGLFFNNFLPTSVAGDIVKAHYAARHTNRSLESYTSVIIDRVFGLFSFVLIATLALVFTHKSEKSPLIVKTIILMLIVSLFLILGITTNFFSRKIKQLTAKINLFKLNQRLSILLDSFNTYKGKLGVLIFCFYTSVFAQVVSIFTVAVLAKGLSINISLGLLFLTLPIIAVLSMFPSINGLGIRESAYVFFLGKFIGKEEAFALSILWLGVMLSISFLGGIVYLLRDNLLKKEKIIEND